uniref:Uncharacterized protein n=1 Tax=Panagrolaimus sp. ES5 TaxID=591445 RepID=A0AC34GGT1_9BILA
MDAYVLAINKIKEDLLVVKTRINNILLDLDAMILPAPPILETSDLSMRTVSSMSDAPMLSNPASVENREFQQ